MIVDEVEGGDLSAVLELLCTGRISLGGELGVEKLEEVDGEAGGIIIHFCGITRGVSIAVGRKVEGKAKWEKSRLTMDALRTVVGPAISSVEGIEMLDVALEPFL